jgi:hypothetical protein
VWACWPEGKETYMPDIRTNFDETRPQPLLTNTASRVWRTVVCLTRPDFKRDPYCERNRDEIPDFSISIPREKLANGSIGCDHSSFSLCKVHGRFRTEA